MDYKIVSVGSLGSSHELNAMVLIAGCGRLLEEKGTIRAAQIFDACKWVIRKGKVALPALLRNPPARSVPRIALAGHGVSHPAEARA